MSTEDDTGPRGARLPRRRWWRRELRRRHGRTGAVTVGAVEEQYRTLLTESPLWAQADPVLRFHLVWSIAPCLAAYRALVASGTTPRVAQEEVVELVAAQMRPLLVALSLLDRLGPSFNSVRRLHRRLVPRLFPAPGFEVDWRRDDAAALRFDISGCFYLRLLHHHGAAHLTAAFCRGDELAFARMSRTLRFHRTGTLAGGAPQCDFLLRPAASSRTGGR